MNPIGFGKDVCPENKENARPASCPPAEAVCSVVQVYFPHRQQAWAYYNTRFPLKKGDLVFVEGKLAGYPGRVTSVNTSFKIRISDYKQVIARANTTVWGCFYSAGFHSITFDPAALPYEQFRSWVLPPRTEDEEYAVQFGKEGVPLQHLSDFGFSPATIDRGGEYYCQNRVPYLCLDGDRGRAIVEGSRPYEVEFRYRDGQVSQLFCSGPCYAPCKHQVAVLLQLQDTLKDIQARYSKEWDASGYFAAVFTPTLFSMAVDGQPQTVLELKPLR